MENQTTKQGNQEVIVENVTESKITLLVNGVSQEISNGLAELKNLLEKSQVQTFQSGRNIYNISHINEANFGFVTGKKAFNEILTKQLLNSLKDYSPFAVKFLEKANQETKDWVTQTRISDKAKDIIAYSFVGILGIQLRKLMAIGKEDLSETKQRKYIEYCIITAKNALQTLCFVLISKLWDYCKEKKYEFTPEQKDIITHFFTDEFERDIDGYLFLFKTLYDIFLKNELVLPMSELKDFGDNLKPDSSFMKACKQLQDANDLLDNSKFTLLTCFDSENYLTEILQKLIFFANYKMVSIKSIIYDEMRNSSPHYLHTYAALGIDSKSNVNAEKVNYVQFTISTDAILLYKGRYQESVNLFPFIIDYNALTLEGGSKICFFSSKDFEDESLNYRFMEDNSSVNIGFKDTLKAVKTMNDETMISEEWNRLMWDHESRKCFKLDSVYLQFQEAKRTILDLKGDGMW